jgi:hypothetical protein
MTDRGQPNHKTRVASDLPAIWNEAATLDIILRSFIVWVAT